MTAARVIDAARALSLTTATTLVFAAADVLLPQSAAAQAPYSFLLRLGTDTVAVERRTPQVDGFVAELVERAPRVVVWRYAVHLDPAGLVDRLEILQRVANPSTRPPTRTVVERQGGFTYAMQYSVRVYRGDSLAIQSDTAITSDAVIPWLLYGSSAYELAFQTLRRWLGDSLVVASASSGSGRLGRMVLRRSAPTYYSFPFFLGQRFVATLDSSGALIAFSGRETTIKVELERLEVALPVDSIAAAWAAREAAVGIARDLSARDTANITVGSATVSVDYGRPLARGRTIPGGVVPFNEVWRTGANAATHLSTSVPLLIDGKTLPAGTYAIWTLPTRSGATLLVSSQRQVWGTAYDANKVVLRARLEPVELSVRPERMTIALERTSEAGVGLSIAWGNIHWRTVMRCADPNGQPRACE